MKKLTTIIVLLYATCGFAQETTFKEYSYSEFFELENAAIVFNSDTICI
ncbi:hypothetical protein JYU05_02235 [bacterium AH-315-P13]|nr:hypothetical protein [bacterium AH-315-P13]MBN4084910.1 hypothetical protein [Flavobacteriaceae bacterium AH-315-B10]